MVLCHSLCLLVSIDSWPTFHIVTRLIRLKTLENDISISCTSMPAFAWFSRTYVAKSKYLAFFRDRIASRFAEKLHSEPKSFVRLKGPHLEDNHPYTLPRWQSPQYSESDDATKAT